MKQCDACGSYRVIIVIGGAFICRDCHLNIQKEIELLRSKGKSVNVLDIAKKMFRETNSAEDYLLRDIPQDLLMKARTSAVNQNCSLRDLILAALGTCLES